MGSVHISPRPAHVGTGLTHIGTEPEHAELADAHLGHARFSGQAQAAAAAAAADNNFGQQSMLPGSSEIHFGVSDFNATSNTVHVCTRARARTHVCTRTHARTYARTHARTHTRTHARTQATNVFHQATAVPTPDPADPRVIRRQAGPAPMWGV